MRHDRRELTAEEQRWLLQTVTDPEKGCSRYGVSPEDRRRLYLMALGTFIHRSFRQRARQDSNLRPPD